MKDSPLSRPMGAKPKSHFGNIGGRFLAHGLAPLRPQSIKPLVTTIPARSRPAYGSAEKLRKEAFKNLKAERLLARGIKPLSGAEKHALDIALMKRERPTGGSTAKPQMCTTCGMMFLSLGARREHRHEFPGLKGMRQFCCAEGAD